MRRHAFGAESRRVLFFSLICLPLLAWFDCVASGPHTNEPNAEANARSADAAVNDDDGQHKPPEINYEKFSTLIDGMKKKLAKQAFSHTGPVYGLESDPWVVNRTRIGFIRSHFEVENAPVVSAQHCWKALRDIGTKIGKPVKVPKIELFCGAPFVLLCEFPFLAHFAFLRRSAKFYLESEKPDPEHEMNEDNHPSLTTASIGSMCPSGQTTV